MLTDLLVDVATLIESTITVEKVAVVAGEPSSSDKDSAAYVWGEAIASAPSPINFAGNDAGCVFVRAYEIAYRIEICRKIKSAGSEQATATQLAEATDLYDKADLVWCAITSAAVDGTLFDTIGDCEAITIGALNFSPPTGDRVAASGTLRVVDPCDTGS